MVSNGSKIGALKDDKNRFIERGMAGFEVLGLSADRELIRAIAKRLAENGWEATSLRATIDRALASKPVRRGGILDPLRRSPLVGTDLDVVRPRETDRKIGR